MYESIKLLEDLLITFKFEIQKLSDNPIISDKVYDLLRNAALRQHDVISALEEARAWHLMDKGDSHST